FQSGFSALELGRISQFNARQRAGRAAREKAGVCWRLWTEHDERAQPQELPPEVQRADLSSALLWLAHLGVRNFAQFSWLEAPSEVALAVAVKALQKIEAFTAENVLTDLGRRLLNFPLPPRLGLILVEAEKMGECRLGAQVAAILNERDFVSGEGA